jgi:beta-N-acetylhexosaminidase
MKNLGQLFCIGVEGKKLSSEEAKFIESENIGGVILFAHNYEDPSQLLNLCNQVQGCRDELPLFISCDQEGGRVQRFKEHFSKIPAMLELASLNSPKTIYEVYAQVGKELRTCGINLNFAPVCDIFNNPENTVIGDRAFGKTARDVDKFISAAVRGLQSEGVLACAKHFPGHGSTLLDSHDHLPHLETPLNELLNEELVPFQKASRSRVEFVMMSHLVVTNIDPSLPFSLSQIGHDFLREKLKYKKIIISDDMEMKAIADNFTLKQQVELAMNAGADILIYRSFAKSVEAYNSLKELIQENKVSKSTIEEKLKRIKSCKINFLSEYQLKTEDDLKEVFGKKNQAMLSKQWADQISKA